jgi:hypothetical protein
MSLADAISTTVPVDVQFNLLPDLPVQSLDFDTLGGDQIELVYDPNEETPFLILVNGELDNAYGNRQSAQIAFDDLIADMISGAKEAQYQQDDRRAGR